MVSHRGRQDNGVREDAVAGLTLNMGMSFGIFNHLALVGMRFRRHQSTYSREV
ncbi:hypothetical protein Micbo1qcDRAFT_71444 [Microdochium bolleyi]|uniref:Uncharacterized protein n=1 Tax=Microdochium bolleyi TaxID=196109 RepID=A0A136J0S0_9PEZI|nr:hypothetical protein Micbo1qcDRAFT_71444 [Microdochium bolleyi]